MAAEFPESKFHGEIAPALDDLVERGIVRALDHDSALEAFEHADLDESEVGQLRAYEAELAALLGEDDVAAVAEAIEPGSTAACLGYENTWAAPFARPCAEPVGSWWPTAEFPFRHYWPRARHRTQEVHEMPLGPQEAPPCRADRRRHGLERRGNVPPRTPPCEPRWARADC